MAYKRSGTVQFMKDQGKYNNKQIRDSIEKITRHTTEAKGFHFVINHDQITAFFWEMNETCD